MFSQLVVYLSKPTIAIGIFIITVLLLLSSKDVRRALTLASFLDAFNPMTYKPINLAFIVITITLISIVNYLYHGGLYVYIALISGILCASIVGMKGNPWGLFIGILGSLVYGAISPKWGMYGNFMLQYIFYFPIYTYAIYSWTTTGWQKPPKNLNVKQIIFFSILIIITTIVYTYVLQYFSHWITTATHGKFKPQTVGWIDSLTNTLSILAVYLMMKRYTEQWVVWLIKDAFSIAMWFYALSVGDHWGSDMAILLSAIAYTINGIIGLNIWRKKSHDHKSFSPPPENTITPT